MTKNKPAIIILHGWGLTGERFLPLKMEFERLGYAVYTPDLPGFGKEAPPDRVFTLGDYAAWVAGYMKRLHIGNAVIIGHSFGGRVSLALQKLAPSDIRAIILTGTPGFTPVPSRKRILAMAVAKAGKIMFAVWPLSLIRNTITSKYYWAVGARDYARADGVMKDVFKRIVREDLQPYMTSVSVPCALIWGADDTITPPWIAQKMKQAIPDAQLIVIKTADHGVPFRQPGVFADRVVTFLKTV